MESCSKVQMCSSHESGSEAAIHEMREILEQEETESVLLVVSSKESTTQGDPIAMATYAIGLTPLLKITFHVINGSQKEMVELADDLTVLGKAENLRK